MAAADLCEIMLREDLKIDLTLEKQVCQVFVNQLDDTSSEVSGNAVKCLSQVMNRIQEQQVGEIIQKVMSHLLEEKTTLSIYSTCAKQVVGDISQNYVFAVIKSFMPNIIKGKACSSSRSQTQATGTKGRLHRDPHRYPEKIRTNHSIQPECHQY